MNILILGSGGREHALAWKIAASPLCKKLYCVPGNAGIAQVAECANVDLADHKAVIAYAREKKIDFVVVGPEAPLCAGIADDLEAAGLHTFGPSKWAARLEGSKGFSKDLCKANNIPTAAYRRFKSAADAKAFVRERGAPIVVKDDGLAAGKGVVVASSVAEAEAAIDAALTGEKRAWEIVIEDCLVGEEASFFALCDGDTAIALGSAQDHKRVGEGDGCAVQGRAVCRIDDHEGRAAAHRIQCALRRSGNAGADAASRLGHPAGPDRVTRRHAEERVAEALR